jgi:RNA polymerase sigma-70 factor (ECF subfamily)
MPLHLVRSQETLEKRVAIDAVDVLYDAYAADVTRWARRLAGPSADVEDIVHDVFLVALRRIHTLRDEANARTWLFRITHNLARSQGRRRFFRGMLFRSRTDEMVAALPVPATPMEVLERREDYEQLYQALDCLSDRYRTTIILYDIDGRDSDEVAELTGVNVATVWARLHRGRAKLVEHLRRRRR